MLLSITQSGDILVPAICRHTDKAEFKCAKGPIFRQWTPYRSFWTLMPLAPCMSRDLGYMEARPAMQLTDLYTGVICVDMLTTP